MPPTLIFAYRRTKKKVLLLPEPRLWGIKMRILLFVVIFLTIQIRTYSIEVHGHRGARSVLPENSLPAFEYAYDIGVDVIELDLTFSKDSEIVVHHDTTTNINQCQSTNPALNQEPRLLRELSLSQIKTFICGNKPHPKFPRQKLQEVKIPTLSEVFELIKKKQSQNFRRVLFNIETKTQEPSGPLPDSYILGFVKQLLSVVEKFQRNSDVIVQSFDERTLIAIKSLNPSLILAGLNYEKTKNSINWAHRLGLDIVSPYYEFATQDYVSRAHKLGLKVIPWTPNTAHDWNRLISNGVDGIITDDPAQLIDHLKSKGLRK